MPYVPNADELTQPTSSQEVASAALEFRTLKAALSTKLPALEARVLRVPGAELVNELPDAASRAGRFFSWDSAGQPTATALPSELTLTSAAPSVEEFVLTAAQSTVTLETAYSVGAKELWVYLDGNLLQADVDWSEVGTGVSSSIQLNWIAEAGQELAVVRFPSTESGLIATLASYTAAGTNATTRTVDAKLREGAVSVLDYASLQDALNTGKNVWIPGGVTVTLTAEANYIANGQEVYGDGYNSVVQQTTPEANALVMNTRIGCAVRNLRVIGGGQNPSVGYLTSNGVLIRSSFRCVVDNITVANHAGSGVQLYNSDHCTVRGSRFILSANASLDGTVAPTSPDIGVVYNSKRNVITGNVCYSSGATGITVQSILDTDAADGNVVVGNVVMNARAYGIICYRNVISAVTGSVSNTVVANNTVRNVSGNIRNPVAMNYSFGAGIYIQGAEYSVVTGNTVWNTHSSTSVTFAETLAPGAIGITNTRNYIVANNAIRTAGMFGIDVGDPINHGLTTGRGLVVNNVITGTVRSGIHLRNIGNVAVIGNQLDACTQAGILTTFSTTKSNIQIADNWIQSHGGSASVYVVNASDVEISGQVSKNGVGDHGIVLSNVTKASVRGGSLSGYSNGEGITVANSSDIMISDVRTDISGTLRHAVSLNAVTDAIVTGLRAHHSGSATGQSAGVYISGASADITISGLCVSGHRYGVFAAAGDGIIANAVNGRQCTVGSVNLSAATNTVTGANL